MIRSTLRFWQVTHLTNIYWAPDTELASKGKYKVGLDMGSSRSLQSNKQDETNTFITIKPGRTQNKMWKISKVTIEFCTAKKVLGGQVMEILEWQEVWTSFNLQWGVLERLLAVPDMYTDP